MNGRVFIDSNIFVYLLDKSDKTKNKKVKEVIKKASEDYRITISTQVLNEVYAASTRKLGIDPMAAKEFLHFLFSFDVVQITQEIIESAIDSSILNKISYWDSLMISAAESSGCSQIWTEDLQNGRIIRGVEVFNPMKNKL